MKEIYAVSGKKGHGKDTFAKLVQGMNGSFSVVHFADKLKAIAQEVFGLSIEQTQDPSLKEVPFEEPIEMDLHLQDMRVLTGLQDLQPAGKVAKAQGDYWIRSTIDGIQDGSRVLIPDTRFINEARAVRDIRGYVIRVTRIDLASSNDTHDSEVEIDKITPDLLIGVRTGDLTLPRWVAALISMGEFTQASRYDFRGIIMALQLHKNGFPAAECADVLWGTGPRIQTFHNALEYYTKGHGSVLSTG